MSISPQVWRGDDLSNDHDPVMVTVIVRLLPTNVKGS
jgi:hypothetical protein